MKKPKNLIDLIKEGYAQIAKLPEKNDISLKEIESLDAYTVPLVSHDYGAKTPVMWNTLYEKSGLNMKNIMLVADPKKYGELIISTLKSDSKYLGGGFGVGWKEKINLLDEIRPKDLSSVNIVVKEKGNLIGYNTDAEGFVRSLEEKFYDVGKDIRESNFVLLGAGGVAKEVARLIAKKGANHITILNRTRSKAVSIANLLNQEYGDISNGAGEEIIRGYALNSFIVPDAIINTTDKGSDGPLADYSAFAAADTESKDGRAYNETISRTIARELSRLNPSVIIADIVLPKNPPSKTLAIAANEGLKNLVDGLGMVVYQAVPAYLKVYESHPEKHQFKKISEKKVLEIFKKSANFKSK